MLKAEVINPEKAPEYTFVKMGDELIYIGKDAKLANRIAQRLNLFPNLLDLAKYLDGDMDGLAAQNRLNEYGMQEHVKVKNLLKLIKEYEL